MTARASAAEQGVALDRAGITVFREIKFLAAGPASERSRSAAAHYVTGGRERRIPVYMGSFTKGEITYDPIAIPLDAFVYR